MTAKQLVLPVLFGLVLAGGLYLVLRDPGRLDTDPATLGETPADAVDRPDRPAPDGDETRAPQRDREPVQRTESRADRAQERGTLVGRVVDGDGIAVDGAKVSCAELPAGVATSLAQLEDREVPGLDEVLELARKQRRASLAETETKPDGRFDLALPRGRPLQLRVEARGFRPHWRRFTAEGSATDLGDLVLERGIVVAGRVVDARGRGVAGARVVEARSNQVWGHIPLPLRRLGGRETDADGRFELLLRKPGEFRLVALHEAHPDAEYTGRAAKLGTEVGGIVIRLADGASIAGTVLGIPAGVRNVRVGARRLQRPRPAVKNDDPFGGFLGAAMENAMDEFGLGTDRTAELDENGKFRLQGLAADATYRIWAVHHRGVLDGQACSEPLTVTGGATAVRLVYSPGATATFQVVDADTGKPITDYKVEAGLERKLDLGVIKAPFTNPRKLDVKPDADGRVRIGGLHPKGDHGVLLVRVGAEGYDTFEKEDIRIPAQGAVDLGVFQLRPAAQVRARVLARQGKKPVADARVVLKEASGLPDLPGAGVRGDFKIRLGGPSGFQARGAATLSKGKTDERGECRLQGSFGEKVMLKVTADGFAPYLGASFELSGRMPVERRIELVVGATVEVTVVDPLGHPRSGIAVERRGPLSRFARAHGGKTDAAGKLRFEHLVPGQHEFRLADASRPFGLDFSLGQKAKDKGWRQVQVADGQSVPLQLTRADRATITGVVTENGTPLAGARIRWLRGKAGGEADALAGLQDLIGDLADHLPRGGGSAKTDASGRYRIEKVAPGAHRLRVSHPELTLPKTFDASITPGDNRIDLRLQTATIAGRITDQHGEPVARAILRLQPAGEKAADSRVERATAAMEELGGMFGLKAGRKLRANANGRYRIRGVPTGTPIQVVAQSKKHVAARSKPVTLAAGQTRDGVDIQLALGGAIVVRVEGGGMLGAVKATREGSKSAEPRLALLKEGTATLRGLEPGTWKVEVRDAAEAAGPSKTVEVKAGETSRIQLVR